MRRLPFMKRILFVYEPSDADEYKICDGERLDTARKIDSDLKDNDKDMGDAREL